MNFLIVDLENQIDNDQISQYDFVAQRGLTGYYIHQNKNGRDFIFVERAKFFEILDDFFQKMLDWQEIPANV